MYHEVNLYQFPIPDRSLVTSMFICLQLIKALRTYMKVTKSDVRGELAKPRRLAAGLQMENL